MEDSVKIITSYTMLPSSGILILALNRIIEAFENPIEIEVLGTRWREIKKLQAQTAVVLS